MEDLEVLESVVLGASSAASSAGDGAAESHASGSLADGSPSSARKTPPKLRRRGASFVIDGEHLIQVKGQEGDQGDAGTVVECKVESLDKTCTGCGRSSSDSFEWLRSEQQIVWANPQRRGFWCKDCHTCWRTCFAALHTLVFFAKWLRDPNNFQYWERRLIAFVTLMAEGAKIITKEDIEGRVCVLGFLERFVGTPMQPFVVMPLKEALELKGDDGHVDASMLVTIRSAAGNDRLGMLVPCDLAKDSSGTFQRPANAGNRLNGRVLLSCHSDEDLDVLRHRFNDTPAVVVRAASENQGPAASPNRSKLEARLDSMCSDFRDLLGQFQSSDWRSLKESRLTTPVSKISCFSKEAASAGEGAALARADQWVAGLAASKQVLRANREYAKTRDKQSKLKDLLEPMSSLRTFLISQDMHPAPSFDLLWHKAVLDDELNAKSACAPGLATLFKNGLAEALQKEEAPSGAGFSAGVWMSDVLFQALCSVLVRTKDETPMQEGVKALAQDAGAVVAAMKESGRLPSSCASVIDDVGLYLTILRAADEGSDVKAQRLDAALKRLESPHLVRLKKALHETKFGRDVLASASHLLAVSARDIAGDEKLKLAAQILEDQRLPHMVQVERDMYGSQDPAPNFAIRNFSLVLDGGISDILDECLGYVNESFRLWSPMRLAHKAADVVSWAQDLAVLLNFCDDCLSVHASAVVRSTHRVAPGVVKSELGEGEDEHGSAFLEALGQTVEKHLPDETSFVRFAETFRDFLVACPAVVKDDNACQQIVDSLNERAVKNAALRADIVEFAACAMDVGTAPNTLNDAVEEWKVKQATANPSDAYFSRAVAMQRAASKLKGASFNFGKMEDGDDPVWELEEGESATSSFVGSVTEAVELASHLHSLPIVAKIDAFLGEGIQLALDELGDAMFLTSIKLQPVVPQDPSSPSQTIPALVEPLVCKSSLHDATKVVAKTFSSIGKKGGPWPCEELFSLLKTILDVTGFEEQRLSLIMAHFHKSAEDAPTWTSRIQIEKAMQVWMPISQVAISLGFLSSRCGSEADMVRDNKIKAEVEAAFSFARTTANSTLAMLDGLSGSIVGDLNLRGWQIPLNDAKEWLTAARCQMAAMARVLVGVAVARAATIAHEVQTFVPKTDHIVNDARLNLTLAKRHLLLHPSRAQLQKKSIELFHSISDSSRLHSQWALQPDLPSDPEWRDDVELAVGVWDSARTVITIIAGVNVLSELVGQEKLDAAASLLSKNAGSLPKALVSELEKAAAGGGRKTDEEGPTPKKPKRDNTT